MRSMIIFNKTGNKKGCESCVFMNRKCRFPAHFTMAMVLRIETEIGTIENEQAFKDNGENNIMS